MRSVLGLPLPDATLEVWAQHFCFSLEPIFVDESLRQRLEPHAVVLTRAEFEFWLRSQPLEYSDAYQPWNVTAECVALLSPAEFSALEQDLRLELNRAIVSSKRGLVFGLDQARTAGVAPHFLARDSADDAFVLRCDAWDALPRAAQFDWLAAYVTEVGVDCLSSKLPGLAALEWVGWLPRSGPNCFATALLPVLGRHTMTELWLLPETFTRALNAIGYTERPLSRDLQAGWVLVWRKGDKLVHAATYLGNDLVLNKDSQGWYSSRQILRLGTVLEGWNQDGLELSNLIPTEAAGV